MKNLNKTVCPVYYGYDILQILEGVVPVLTGINAPAEHYDVAVFIP
ncbi:MAG: hypothetical protein K6F28_04230 [Lachnospiraceae bacterium]|nr:hypothetical protein [Lachnospiraceae bacterium]